jgi:mgtE-like transporter
MRISRSVMRQSYPFLFATGLGQMVACLLFGGMENLLREAPGLIVLIPSIIGLRGNIGSALACRLGTATHLGFVSSEQIWNDRSRSEIWTSIVLSTFLSAMAGAVAYLSCLALGMEHISLGFFMLISTATGVIAGTVLSFMTLSIIFYADKHGADPDNVAAPALATAADIITLGVLFLVIIASGVVS